jgi:hypothetical protein
MRMDIFNLFSILAGKKIQCLPSGVMLAERVFFVDVLNQVDQVCLYFYGFLSVFKKHELVLNFIKCSFGSHCYDHVTFLL